MPELAQQDPYDVVSYNTLPEITVLLTVSAHNPTSSLPAYVMMPCDMTTYYNKIAGPQVKLFDFGSGKLSSYFCTIVSDSLYVAHSIGTPHPHMHCSPKTCAPEIAFSRISDPNSVVEPAVEPSADVWSLGATVRSRSSNLLHSESKLTCHARFTRSPLAVHSSTIIILSEYSGQPLE